MSYLREMRKSLTYRRRTILSFVDTVSVVQLAGARLVRVDI